IACFNLCLLFSSCTPAWISHGKQGVTFACHVILLPYSRFRLSISCCAHRHLCASACSFACPFLLEKIDAPSHVNSNTAKLAEVRQGYVEVTQAVCAQLNRAWDERLQALNAILGRVVLFEESLSAYGHLQAIGVTRVLESAIGGKWGALTVEPFLRKAETKHMEGPLTKRGKVMKTR
ncbi:unnamed protein product, partial [Phaeothamnion confervicola]